MSTYKYDSAVKKKVMGLYDTRPPPTNVMTSLTRNINSSHSIILLLLISYHHNEIVLKLLSYIIPL